MPQKPIAQDWRDQVYTLCGSGRKRSVVEMFQLLEAEGIRLGRNDYPSKRSLNRIRDDFHRLPEPQQREYGQVRWPDSFGRGDLPWEAGRAALDLLRFHDEQGLDRPTVRHVRWFWRVGMAAPGIPTQDADRLSEHLATAEFLAVANLGTTEVQGLEWLLAYQPWRSDDDAAAYQRLAARQDVPRYPTLVATSVLDGTPEALRSFYQALLGPTSGQERYEQVARALYKEGEATDG
ncbi:MAG: hypothetical protein HY690_02970 [Chloroflexi bacterium]|nr:hypothetical protein [Chloroflexota bacterium]